MLLVTNLANTKIPNDAKKKLKNDQNPGISVSFESAPRELSSVQGLDGFKNLYVLVLWTNVASALEGLTCIPPSGAETCRHDGSCGAIYRSLALLHFGLSTWLPESHFLNAHNLPRTVLNITAARGLLDQIFCNP